MLTVKQDGKRVVNPDLRYVNSKNRLKMESLNWESIFKILVVECGFQASHRDGVWTHTQDDLFSVQLDTRNNRFLFEYKYKSDSHAFLSDMEKRDFISLFLETSREFFKRVKLSE